MHGAELDGGRRLDLTLCRPIELPPPNHVAVIACLHEIARQVFILTSTLGGLTGILEAFRIGSTDPLAGGSNIMFLAVAAAVIGGTALAGGSGTIFGGLVGAVVLGVLRDGFTLEGINAFTFDLIIGAGILVAMLSNIYLARLHARGRRT